jgi:hypothetical protein
MIRPSQSPGARLRVPSDSSCAFTGRNLTAARKIDPKQFFWDTHTQLEDAGIVPTPHNIARIARAWGVPLTAAAGRAFLRDFEARVAKDDADFAARLAQRNTEGERRKIEATKPPALATSDVVLADAQTIARMCRVMFKHRDEHVPAIDESEALDCVAEGLEDLEFLVHEAEQIYSLGQRLFAELPQAHHEYLEPSIDSQAETATKRRQRVRKRRIQALNELMGEPTYGELHQVGEGETA